MNRMNLVILLDRLEELAATAPVIPFSGKGLVDMEELADLVDKIRSAIPEEIRLAEEIAQERERVIQQAQLEGKRIVEQAQEYAAKLVHNNEIIKKAREEAAQVVEEGRKKAQEMELGAREYADEVLSNLQQALERTLVVVERGRDELGTAKTNKNNPGSAQKSQSKAHKQQTAQNPQEQAGGS
ncbi:MAG: DUF1068 domain-containing protein [Limnochordia bacterium]